MKQVTEEFYEAAIKLADYIASSQGECEEYEELLNQGIDKKSCIYYQAEIIQEQSFKS